MELKITLDGKLRDKFLAVKENTGMVNDDSVLRFLISDAYGKIQDTKYRKLFVDPEVYERIEKQAEAEGVTVDIYTTELLKKQIERELKEGMTHEKPD